MTDERPPFGAVLRELRKARGWSLTTLEQRSGIDRNTIYRLENAVIDKRTQKAPQAKTDTIVNLGRALSVGTPQRPDEVVDLLLRAAGRIPDADTAGPAALSVSGASGSSARVSAPSEQELRDIIGRLDAEMSVIVARVERVEHELGLLTSRDWRALVETLQGYDAPKRAAAAKLLLEFLTRHEQQQQKPTTRMFPRDESPDEMYPEE